MNIDNLLILYGVLIYMKKMKQIILIDCIFFKYIDLSMN